MGAVKLEPRCPQRVGGIVIDPQPDWSFDGLLSELSLIEKKLHVSSASPFSIMKEVFSAKSAEKRGFVMRVDEMEDSEEDSKGEACDWPLVRARRFTCDEFDISYDSEDDSMSGTLCHLMDKVGLIEGALSELTHEHQLSVKDEIRNQILAWEADLMIENNKFTSALAQVKKYVEARQEMDRKLDVQYQRKKAEALDNHLTAVQRDHEHKSQIEERRIRDDAAIEEAKRREKALQEEKFRQEKLRAEAEARLEAEKKRAEEAKAAALETERKAAKEAEKKIAAEDSARSAAAAAVVPSKEATGSPKRASLGTLNDQSNKSVSDGVKTVQQAAAGNALKCAESALKLEERRRQIYQEVAAKNASLGLGSSSAHLSLQLKINRLIKQISGSKENVRKKVDQLNQIFVDSSCPQSISVAIYAEKIVDQCVNPNNSVFAYAYVTVLLASQVPLVMDLVLAKLNKVCIYTVPKYISYSKSSFDTKEAHYKAIGYKEEDGQIENEESYVSGIASYMSLYGALVQTEIQGIQHAHGLGEGWSWLARFLNALPANLYTAVALQAFLEVAGFGLYRRYKSQFKKLLSIVYHDFTSAFKEPAGVNPKLSRAITGIRTYMETKGFLKEPEGRSLQNSLLSHDFVPDLESSDHYHYQQSRPFYHY